MLEGYAFQELLKTTERLSPMPSDGIVYVASVPELETLQVATALRNRAYGGMPVQIGYCNGANSKLNCLEYHRDSEVLIAANDMIFLLAFRGDLENFHLDTQKVEAFRIPAGTGVELFATTLHYAPVSATKGAGYRMVVVLPRGTNGPKPDGLTNTGEDRLCLGTNKWLIAHPGSDEAKAGAFVGLDGENIDLYKE